MITVNEIMVGSYVSASKLPDADYVINPYVGCPHKCIYCYAEFMKRFTQHTSDEWGTFIDIKKCDKTIDYASYPDESTILIGSVTDAYNPYEKQYEITRNILSKMDSCNAQIEILTKSDLVLRDIDLIKKIKNIKVGLSLNTTNDVFRKQTEPFASSISRRIEALKTLKSEGISTYLFMSPIFPELTNFKEIIEDTKKYFDYVCFENLNLRGAYLPKVIDFIRNNYPEHFNLFDEIYRSKNISYWERLKKEITEYCTNQGIEHRMYFYHELIKKGAKNDGNK